MQVGGLVDSQDPRATEEKVPVSLSGTADCRLNSADSDLVAVVDDGERVKGYQHHQFGRSLIDITQSNSSST